MTNSKLVVSILFRLKLLYLCSLLILHLNMFNFCLLYLWITTPYTKSESAFSCVSLNALLRKENTLCTAAELTCCVGKRDANFAQVEISWEWLWKKGNILSMNNKILFIAAASAKNTGSSSLSCCNPIGASSLLITLKRNSSSSWWGVGWSSRNRIGLHKRASFKMISKFTVLRIKLGSEVIKPWQNDADSIGFRSGCFLMRMCMGSHWTFNHINIRPLGVFNTNMDITLS